MLVPRFIARGYLSAASPIPLDNFGTVVGENPDCLLLSGTVVGENPDHVYWDVSGTMCISYIMKVYECPDQCKRDRLSSLAYQQSEIFPVNTVFTEWHFIFIFMLLLHYRTIPMQMSSLGVERGVGNPPLGGCQFLNDNRVVYAFFLRGAALCTI